MKAYKFLIAVLMLSFFILLGCGGGTTGTGEFETKMFSGTVTGAEGVGRAFRSTVQPLAGVTVTVEQSGDFAVTNAEGRYTITTALEPGDVTLRVEGEGFDARADLGRIEAGQNEIRADLAVQTSGDIQVTSLEINPLPNPDGSAVGDNDDEEDGEVDVEDPDDTENPPVEEPPLPSLFEGRVFFKGGSDPVSDAKVALVGVKSATTGSSGSYSFQANLKKGRAIITVQFGKFEGDTSFNFPGGSQRVTANFELNITKDEYSRIQSNQISIASVDTSIDNTKLDIRKRKGK